MSVKGDGMAEFLFKKSVDQSVLKDGMTIPRDIHQKLLECLGIALPKGRKERIVVQIGDEEFEAIITNIDFDDRWNRKETLQIRYSSGSPICRKLNDIFRYSSSVVEERRNQQSSSSTKMAENEYIDIYAVDRLRIELRCYPTKMKEEFIKYIGRERDLTGYQRSYKLVFLQSFFMLLDKGNRVDAEQLTKAFRDFYVERKKAGLIPDMDVDKVIANIEESSLKSIYSLIQRNPYNAISGKEYIKLIEGEGKPYYQLAPEIHRTLDPAERHMIEKTIAEKIKYYYSRIDEGQNEEMKNIVDRILNEYQVAKNQTFAGHELGSFFRSGIPEAIYGTGIVDSSTHLITGSVGQGNWATIPWICIFDRSITTSAQRGVYIVYLLSKDGNTLYLTFNQGCTDLSKQHSKQETIRIMQERAKAIRSKIDARGFSADDGITLGENLPDLGNYYQKGTIFYKAYRKGAVPSDSEIRDDLIKMMQIYADYVCLENGEVDREYTGGEEELSIKECVESIKNYIASKGFSYENSLIENFYLSLKSKPFVILAGTSGTGKTRLVKLFAEAVGATTENGRYQMVSVRPDWSDSSDLFGHIDLHGKFIPGAIIDFVKRAEVDRMRPYFLCLDEMNLARVEYYLSDVLSIIETRDFNGGEIVSDPLISMTYYGSDHEAAGKYGTVRLPENLYIIGTVNMDETTFPFSRKVLDRANTIEFSYVELMPRRNEGELEVYAQNLPNAFLKTEYLLLSQCDDAADDVDAYCVELQSINKILQKANAHVGYRVRDEIVFYLLNNKKAELISQNEAMDNEIMQKILPRIQGSSASIKNMLCELFKLCAGDYAGYQTEGDDLGSKMLRAAQDVNCKYKKSAEKIAFMVRRYEEDGFTSYWL